MKTVIDITNILPDLEKLKKARTEYKRLSNKKQCNYDTHLALDKVMMIRDDIRNKLFKMIGI